MQKGLIFNMRSIIKSTFRRAVFGRPLRTAELAYQKIGNIKALAVFSSDALSSVAYGTEEILWVLVAAAAFNFTEPILLAIVALLVILTLSYRQTIRAYPNGGGSYIVAQENLGKYAGLIAGASLTTDYILTVAVSVSAGIAAITSVYPLLLPYKVMFCLIAVGVIMLVNLRGIKESGSIFAIPTYAFLLSTIALIAVGVVEYKTGTLHAVPIDHTAFKQATEPLSILLILKAFSAGCTSLTGVEAISNGVPSFKAPEARNAGRTMAWMGISLGTMSLGVGYLATVLKVVPNVNVTVMSQIAAAVYGDGSLLYTFHQWVTMLILILAANTSFAGFPGLGYVLSKNGYLPRSMSMKGDRLVYNKGILLLGGTAAVLIVIFNGTQHLLMPLYAIGVFLSFTLCQAGMVKHWLKLRKEQNVSLGLFINGIGAITTAVVLFVIIMEKFTQGAWIIAIIIPFFVYVFASIKKHYEKIRAFLKVGEHKRLIVQKENHLMVFVIGATTHVAQETVEFILTMVNQDVKLRAVHINVHKEGHEKTLERIREFSTWVGDQIPLDVCESPYRSILEPLEDYMLKLQKEYPDYEISMVIPELVFKNSLIGRILHGGTGRLINNHFQKLGFNVFLVPFRVD